MNLKELLSFLQPRKKKTSVPEEKHQIQKYAATYLCSLSASGAHFGILQSGKKPVLLGNYSEITGVYPDAETGKGTVYGTAMRNVVDIAAQKVPKFMLESVAEGRTPVKLNYLIWDTSKQPNPDKFYIMQFAKDNKPTLYAGDANNIIRDYMGITEDTYPNSGAMFGDVRPMWLSMFERYRPPK